MHTRAHTHRQRRENALSFDARALACEDGGAPPAPDSSPASVQIHPANDRRVIRFDIETRSYDSVGIIYGQVLLCDRARARCSATCRASVPIIMRDLIHSVLKLRTMMTTQSAEIFLSRSLVIAYGS